MKKTLTELLQPIRDLRANDPKELDKEARLALLKALNFRVNAFYMQTPLKPDLNPQFIKRDIKNWLRYICQQPRPHTKDIREDLELLRPDFLNPFHHARLWIDSDMNEEIDPYPKDGFAYISRNECPGLEDLKISGDRIYSELCPDTDIQKLSASTLAKRKAFLAKPELTHVTISVPSGVLMAADWFRIEQFTKAVHNQDKEALSINYHSGQAANTKHLAQHHVFSVHVGNSSPSLCINTDLPGVIQGVALDEDHDSLFDENEDYLGLPENLQLKGHVCTDLWNTTMIDKQVLIGILVSCGNTPKKAEKIVSEYLKENDVEIIMVEPGVYHGYCFYGNNEPGLADWTVNGKPLMPEIAQSYWLLSPTPLNLEPLPKREIPVIYTTTDNRIIDIGLLEVTETGWCLKTPLESISSTFTSDEPLPKILDLSIPSNRVKDILKTCDNYGFGMNEHLAWLELPMPLVTDKMLDDSLQDCTEVFERFKRLDPPSPTYPHN